MFDPKGWQVPPWQVLYGSHAEGEGGEAGGHEDVEALNKLILYLFFRLIF